MTCMLDTIGSLGLVLTGFIFGMAAVIAPTIAFWVLVFRDNEARERQIDMAQWRGDNVGPR